MAIRTNPPEKQPPRALQRALEVPGRRAWSDAERLTHRAKIAAAQERSLQAFSKATRALEQLPKDDREQLEFLIQSAVGGKNLSPVQANDIKAQVAADWSARKLGPGRSRVGPYTTLHEATATYFDARQAYIARGGQPW